MTSGAAVLVASGMQDRQSPPEHAACSNEPCFIQFILGMQDGAVVFFKAKRTTPLR